MLISGKAIADKLLLGYQQTIQKAARAPQLAVLLPPNNPASESYVRMKEKACAKIGIASPLYRLPQNITQQQLLAQIAQLNEDPLIDGILLQLPLPAQIDEKKLLYAIDPSKDVDGFHPLNMGRLLRGDEDGFIPCTPLGIKVLLQMHNIDIAGKHVVIVGRSSIVGKPLAALLLQKSAGANATVTVAHSQSLDLERITQSADILIAAIGKPKFITERMVKKGAVVIDVGITRISGKLVGDVDFEPVSKKCSAITPVPGGVGPMTVAMLMHNTLKSFQNRC